MKKTYGKPTISFENFAFSNNIASSCSAVTHAENNCGSYAMQGDPTTCFFYSNEWLVFYSGVCESYPEENKPGDLCYHVSTDSSRAFAS